MFRLFKKERTRVYVFLNRSPIDWWESSVHYDASGHPTVRDGVAGHKLRRRIFEDSSCEGASSWKFKSGPAISFPPQSDAAFESALPLAADFSHITEGFLGAGVAA